MIEGLTVSNIANSLTGLALALVGLYVARVGRGAHANAAFAVYAGGFGLAAVFDPLLQNRVELPVEAKATVGILVTLLALVSLGGLVAFLRTFPRAEGWRGLRWPAAAFLFGCIAYVPEPFVTWQNLAGRGDLFLFDVARLSASVAFDMLRLGLLCAALHFALKFHALRDDPSSEPQRLALVAAALVVYPAAYTFYSDLDELARGNFAFAAELIASGVILAIVTAVWLAGTRSRHHSVAARNVAIVGWAAALVGGLFLVVSRATVSPAAFARTIEILLLAYAVVRYQILGIDVKVRWTISKGTLGAIFVGVFFVASETAQMVFGAVASSELIGILAAGALVFALAPLQRAADRLAERAIPLAAPVPTPAPSAATLYRKQVELAWTDGRIAPNERVMLRGLRKSLGLDASIADDIEHEIETARMRGE